VLTTVEALAQEVTKDFVKSSKVGNADFLTQHHSNKNRHFLAVAEYGEDGQRGDSL
jgi:hypothetical protein